MVNRCAMLLGKNLTNNNYAFTLVELLIVINVIALLLALAVPAIMMMTEAARSAQCSSNLRQLGVALTAYQTSIDTFPPSMIWSQPGLVVTAQGVYPPGTVDLHSLTGNWQVDRERGSSFVQLLPYLDVLGLSQQWDSNVPASSPVNQTVRATSVSCFLCPSDRTSSSPKYQVGDTTWARGNYAINAGPDLPCLAANLPGVAIGSPLDWSCRHLFPDSTPGLGVSISPANPLEIAQVWGSGIAGINRSVRSADIRDGLSKSVAIDEIKCGSTSSDRRGVWASGLVGASVTFGHGGETSEFAGPNQCLVADHVQGCSEGFSGRNCMPCVDGYGIGLRLLARSSHPVGVHILLADGSVATVDNGIDIKVWTAMHTIDNGDDL